MPFPTTSRPTVSVIVPAYDVERFVAQTLLSIRAQTFPAWECIVVDDGSTDGTRAIVERICLEDSRIRYQFQPNRGLAAARNAGLAGTVGTYIQFLDSDDLIDPSKFELQVQILDADNTLGVSYSNYRPFDDATGSLREPFWPEMLGNDPLSDFLFRWERGLSIPIHAAMFRRSLWPGDRAFEEQFRAKEDWLMWIDLALRGVRFAFIDRELAYYRQLPDSLHQDPSMGLTFLRAAFTIRDRIPEGVRERFVAESVRHALAVTSDETIRRLQLDARVALAEVRRVRNGQLKQRNREDSLSSSASMPVACTIISRSYLSHARILARSFAEHHPQARFFVLVVDGLPDGETIGPGVRCVNPEELQIPYLTELALKYDVVEFCTALKPSFLQFLFERCAVDSVVYLDPDIMLFRQLSEAADLLETCDLVLTPHLLTPIPLDGKHPSEIDVFKTGIFNLGFLALRRSAETYRFLRWWAERLRDGCHRHPAMGQFVDQKWIDIAPIYFESTHILRDETYNVAYWNLHSRRLERKDGQFVVNGQPLTFFHFSGIDFQAVQFHNTHQDRFRIGAGSALADLVGLYRELQDKNGYQNCRKWEYEVSRFDNGQPFNWVLRQLYASLSEEMRQSFGEITKSKHENSFWRWSLSPAPQFGGLSPFLKQLYSMRHDVAIAFPDPSGVDRQAFLDWARSSGAREMGYDPALVSGDSE